MVRAIHDPSGQQGPIKFQGKEHDGVFIDRRTMTVYEFTTRRDKEKAVYDASKIRDLLQHLQRSSENRTKAATGYFVTPQEPEIEQRVAVENIAKASGIGIYAISFLSLRKSLVDSEDYISLRRLAPFGSADFKYNAGNTKYNVQERYVEPTLAGNATGTLEQLVTVVADGSPVALTADFGAGKSAALRQVFERLRSRYFKAPAENQFPVHINLRDCYGLRTPREVFARHSDEVGFKAPEALLAAWRAGACILLLDGFDELIPARWVGGAKDLKSVRWQALEPVRRLIAETPTQCGVAVAGRPQYFAGSEELRQSLGLPTSAEIVTLQDLDPAQMEMLIGEGPIAIPDWVPKRPLLLKYLAESGLLEATQALTASKGEAWWELLDMIAAREADRVSSITPETFRTLIGRIATLARGTEVLSMEGLRQVFQDVCGYPADEEGLQALERLPGLSNAETSTHREEVRFLADTTLAEAAYGSDLCAYIKAPFLDHPLAQRCDWANAAGDLPVQVAAAGLALSNVSAAGVESIYNRRCDLGIYDSASFDLVRLIDELATSSRPNSLVAPFIHELLISDLSLTGDPEMLLASATFKDCVIESLDVLDLDYELAALPLFTSCLIGQVDGWGAIPDAYQDRFVDCIIERYSPLSSTTDALTALPVPVDDRVGLVILRKVYLQKGAGRRESALQRGLPLTDRPAVASVLQRLTREGVVTKIAGKGENLILPVKEIRSEVLRALERPQIFRLTQFVRLIHSRG